MLEGCESYLAYVIDTEKASPMLVEILIVRDFPNVFPDNLPGFSPHREVDFTIETLIGVALISIAPYRIAPVELQELKKQIQELLEKEFTKLRISSWGARLLFLKKKDSSVLRHVMYGDGVMPDPAKMKAIIEWRVLKNVIEVRSFSDVSKQGLGCVLMQIGKGKRAYGSHPIPFLSIEIPKMFCLTSSHDSKDSK
ncbi:hypothetical protein Sango_2834100 [Sesamum angolense]|uniref:Uncharacterized protein n=1 Tax=Sesamum angolense TaxID=2727404 RepID=A0AAE1T625_9LAMI|nr:hypothetical protein Sango_2834100 [Sesamum angolense]